MRVLVLFSGFCSQHFALPVPNPLDIQDYSGTDPHDPPMCTSVLFVSAWCPGAHVPTWNNGRGSAKSDLTTCLLITRRHRNPIFRSKQAGLQVHEFPFSVFCTGCRIGQESLTGLKPHHVFTLHIEAMEPNFSGPNKLYK